MQKMKKLFLFTKSKIIDELKRKDILNSKNIFKGEEDIQFCFENEKQNDLMTIQVLEPKNVKDLDFSIEEYHKYLNLNHLTSDLLYGDLVSSTQTFLNQ